MRISMRSALICGLAVLLTPDAVTGGRQAATQEGGARRLAIVVAHDAAMSLHDSYRARNSARSMAGRLEALGYTFIKPQRGGTCAAPAAENTVLDAGQAEQALICAGQQARAADIVAFYYVGPVMTVGGTTYILQRDGTSGAVDPPPRTAVASLLQEAAARAGFVSLIVIDAIEAKSAAHAAGGRPGIARLTAVGTLRITAFAMPAGEGVEPPNLLTTAYTRRLLTALDAEIAAMRDGKPLRDIRDIMTSPDLVSATTWPKRSREVLVEGFGAETITFIGWEPVGSARSGKTDCETGYADAVGRGSCRRLLQLHDACANHRHMLVFMTALRLRCPEEAAAHKRKALQPAFAEAEAKKSCAVMNRFVDQHGSDFDLADAPEMEKAVALKTRLCGQEAREKQIAALEDSLRTVLSDNDCAALKRFERESGRRLTSEQADRLSAVTRSRCEAEEKAAASLRECLERSETVGMFCGAEACFQAFRTALPKEAYFTPHRTESRRQAMICREHAAMGSCFAEDECGGERCSLPLRLAVANGPLIGHIQKLELEAKKKCDLKRDLELRAKLEAERERERREQEMRAEWRRAATVRLTLCNHSTKGRIWVALAYYDYDISNWIVEGWWEIEGGNCNYAGDNFRRGSIYFYAIAANERYVWRGKFGLCLYWVRFRHVNSGGISCGSDRHRLFAEKQITSGEYSQVFSD